MNIMSKKEIENLEKLANYYQREGSYKEEFETLERLLVVKEAAFDKEKKEKISELQAKFETKGKDKLIQQAQSFNATLQTKNKDLSEALAKQKRLDLHLKSLQLQLSPHFIFNTLQSIQSYIFQQDPVEASDYLAKFASLMRAILKSSRQDAITLAEEVELLKQYLELEQKRFDHSFQFEIEVEEQLDLEGEVMPSLLLQPFVENAILHGIVGLKTGRVRIVFRKRIDFLYVHIIDNGIGREASKKIQKGTHQGSATALKIMKERANASQNSTRFTYHFSVRDKLYNSKVVGTHILVRIKNKMRGVLA
jgi:sensor histidine kinase YesM